MKAEANPDTHTRMIIATTSLPCPSGTVAITVVIWSASQEIRPNSESVSIKMNNDAKNIKVPKIHHENIP